MAAARWPRSISTALVVLMMLCGCSDRATPAVVRLDVLAAHAPDFDGRTVRTEGTVHHFEDPLHYWIEDDDFNRVRLLPDAAAAPYLGRTVRVEGRFSFAADQGRRLQIREIVAADE